MKKSNIIANPDELRIYLLTETLTDGSDVFNVRLGDTVIPAISEDDAINLADEMANLINDHSNTLAVVIYR